MEDAIPAWMGGELIKKIWEATAEPAATMSHLRGMGFSEEQVEESRKSAQTTQQDILGSSYAGNLELISKLQSVIQDPEASIKAMPAFAGLGVVLDSYGHGNEGNELMNAIKAGEFRGVLTQVDPNTGKEGFSLDNLLPFIREVMATDVATHGSVGPGQILQFLRASGVSGRMIGDRALFADSMAVIQSMGAANAGRGLQALQLQYSAGKQSDAGVSMGIEMGIYRPSHRTKKGEIVDDKTEQVVGRKLGVGDWLMEPQAFADPSVLGHLRKDPAWFALEYLGPRLNTWVEKNYSDQLNRPGISAQEREELKKGDILGAYQMVTSRIPGGKYAGEIEASHLLLNRDRDALKSMLGIDPGTGRTVGQPRDILGIEQQNNPQVIQKGFEASWKAFEASLGESAMKPATDALNALTNILNRFSDWARKNPDGAEHALEGLAGGVALFGAGSLAAAAMATMTSGPASFLALAGGIEVLGRSLTSVPHWLIDMAAGAAAGAKLGGIGGLPGRAIGAVGGAAVGATIGIDPFHVDERVGNLLGGIFTKDDHKQQGPVPNPQATSQPGQQPAQQPQNQSIMLQGNVHLNNQVVGTFSAAQANAASRPPAGPTNPDPRFTLPSPGWTAVLP